MNVNDDAFFAFEPNGVAIYLYGENRFAKQTYSVLKNKSYNVRGYIDSKYPDYYIEKNIIKVGLNNIELLEKGMKNYIVIICLQNGMQHEKVAELLYQKGIQKIIYLPMGIKCALRKQEIYRRAYWLIQEFRYEEIKKLPLYNGNNDTPFIIIYQNKHEVSFWCPVKYLHSSTSQMIKHNVPDYLKNAIPKLLEYADVAVSDYKPYIELFKYLRGDAADIDSYLTTTGRISETEKEIFLTDRKHLYKVYEEAFCYNMLFFMDSPARAVWNTNGYFNISDGMHRIQYLFSKGFTSMPIVVDLQAFEYLSNFIREKETVDE